MAEKILVKTDLLERCAGELRTAAAGFGDAASILSGLNTSQEWWDKIGGFSALQLRDEGKNAAMGSARSTVSGMTSVLRRYDGRAVRLGDSVARAATLFRETENRLGGVLTGEGAGGSTSGSAFVDLFGALGLRASEAIRDLKSPGATDQNGMDGSSGGQKSWTDSWWWNMLKGGMIKFGAPWAVAFETADFFGKGKTDGYSIGKYAAKATKPIAKWLGWYLTTTDHSTKQMIAKTFLNGTISSTGKTAGEQWVAQWAKQYKPSGASEVVGSTINTVFSGITTGIDNLKEWKTGAISGDRAVVEWGTEWALDVLKTTAISSAGAAVGTAAAAFIIGATPVGWAAVAATAVGTAVVAGGYCVVDWAWKNFLSPVKDSKGIISDIGHGVGEAYDWGKKKVKEVGKKVLDGAKSLGKWAASKVKVNWSFGF